MQHDWLIAALAILAVSPGFSSAHAQPPGMPAPVVGDPGPNGRRIDADGVFANFYVGAGEGRRPAILYLGGSEGGLNPASHWLIDSLTGAGLDVLYVCYFGCPGTPPTLASVPLETFDRALAWLKKQSGVDAARLGVVGGSKGAEAALLTAARHPELQVVVVGMPTSVAWPAIPASEPPSPSWTSGGAPVAFLPYSTAAFAKGGIFGLYNDALPTEAQHPDAVIKVELITAPLMIVCGEADTLWPSCRMADEIAARRAANGKPAPTILRYANAGHGVFGPPPPMVIAALASLGGTPEGNRAARADGWPKVLAFVRTQLRPSAAVRCGRRGELSFCRPAAAFAPPWSRHAARTPIHGVRRRRVASGATCPAARRYTPNTLRALSPSTAACRAGLRPATEARIRSGAASVESMCG